MLRNKKIKRIRHHTTILKFIHYKKNLNNSFS